MNPIPHKTPKWVKKLYHKRIWDEYEKGRGSKTIYLTFDDGPIPEVTPWVMKTLAQYNAKASFFCIGENLKKNPKIAKQLLEDGHGLGNHTFQHLNGWKTPLSDYLEGVTQTEKLFDQLGLKTNLFRPPYGRITSLQAESISAKGYKIVMWDVLSKDYLKTKPASLLLQKSIEFSQSGSIIVFHDSQKAFTNLQYILPNYLRHFSDLGFTFEKL